MKTKEFIRRVEELGYKVHYAPESILVYDEYGITYAKILPYQYAISTIGDGFYDRKKHKELYKLCIDYASTPIEDGEEVKKFCLKHKWENKKFTRKEIEEIKEKFDINWKDFAVVEVVDEKM